MAACKRCPYCNKQNPANVEECHQCRAPLREGCCGEPSEND